LILRAGISWDSQKHCLDHSSTVSPSTATQCTYWHQETPTAPPALSKIRLSMLLALGPSQWALNLYGSESSAIRPYIPFGHTMHAKVKQLGHVSPHNKTESGLTVPYYFK
jgi:hypothetical protein